MHKEDMEPWRKSLRQREGMLALVPKDRLSLLMQIVRLFASGR